MNNNIKEINTLYQLPGISLRIKILMFLSILFCLTPFTSHILTNKIIHYHSLYFTGGTLIIACWFQLGDIVTELYGYITVKYLTWITLFICIAYAVVIKLVLTIKSPHQVSDTAYQLVLGKDLIISLTSALGVIAGCITNAYCMSKWKIILKGRIFWLRSFGSSLLTIIIYSFIATFIDQFHRLSIKQMINLSFSSDLYEIILLLFLLPISSVIVGILKEKIGDTYDLNINFNPFKI